MAHHAHVAVCLHCTTAFRIAPYRAATAQFCSRTCKGAYQTRETQQTHEARFGMPIRDVLHTLYEIRGLTTRQVAVELGISTRTLFDWAADLGYAFRDRSTAVARQWHNNAERRTKTAQQAARVLAPFHYCGDSNVARRPDIARKISESKTGKPVLAQRGARNANWRGGHSDYRGPDWEQQRKLALARDNHACQHCGATECGLQVHHVVPFRISHDNALTNLLTLCPSCHSRAEAAWERAHPVQQARLRLF